MTYKSTAWLSSRMSSAYSSKYIHIIDRMPLGQNKFIAIMELKDKTYLIGVTENNIEILKELEGEFELPPVNLNSQIKFSDVIKKKMRKANRNEPDEKN